MICSLVGLSASMGSQAFGQTGDDARTDGKDEDVKIVTPPKPVGIEPVRVGEDDETRKALEGLKGTSKEDPILELLDGIGKNMKSIEDLLNQPNTGASTQGLQGQAIDQIEKLIEEIQKRGTT